MKERLVLHWSTPFKKSDFVKNPKNDFAKLEF